MPSYDEQIGDGRHRSQPRANNEENGIIRALDQQRILRFRCSLVRLVAVRLATRPALQKLLADIVAGREPGGPNSLLAGQSKDRIAQTRSRLVREIVTATKMLATASPDPVQRLALNGLASEISRSLRTKPSAASYIDQVSGTKSDEHLSSVAEAIAGWVSLMKEGGADNGEFLLPGGV